MKTNKNDKMNLILNVIIGVTIGYLIVTVLDIVKAEILTRFICQIGG